MLDLANQSELHTDNKEYPSEMRSNPQKITIENLGNKISKDTITAAEFY